MFEECSVSQFLSEIDEVDPHPLVELLIRDAQVLDGLLAHLDHLGLGVGLARAELILLEEWTYGFVVRVALRRTSRNSKEGKNVLLHQRMHKRTDKIRYSILFPYRFDLEIRLDLLPLFLSVDLDDVLGQVEQEEAVHDDDRVRRSTRSHRLI